jgi:excinuclease UvrABC nuclease subunit
MSLKFSAKIKATPQNLGKVPDRAGVYKLYSSRGIIYIGRSSGGKTTIKDRLKSHYSGYEGRCTKHFSYFRYAQTTADKRYEEELLNDYKKRYGKYPCCNDRKPK